MHLAAALETPVLALFGPADPARTGPYGVGHRVVRARPDGPAPMGELTVARVLAAARERLGALRSR
jgi:ADP-heptose:LPS heptosyltransferase